MKKNRPMTDVDYVALAICPALIVLMLTALTHFVVLCLYQGAFYARVTYVLTAFIVGATGITRITIQSGRAYALTYAGVLGLAVMIVLSTFSNFLFAICMVAVLWYLADRITCDCTVIPLGLDTSGEGLLGAGSLFFRKVESAPPDDAFIDGTTHRSIGNDSPVKKTSQKPGKSVFYLAIVGLPLFAVGQRLLPNRPGADTQATISLGLYLFASLMLLVVTSFLDLRRYLRQRGSAMPAGVSTAWMTSGAILVVGLLILCFVLPIPGRMLAVAPLLDFFSETQPETGLTGWGNEKRDSAPIRNEGHQEKKRHSQASNTNSDTKQSRSGNTNEKSSEPTDSSRKQEEASNAKRNGKARNKTNHHSEKPSKNKSEHQDSEQANPQPTDEQTSPESGAPAKDVKELKSQGQRSPDSSSQQQANNRSQANRESDQYPQQDRQAVSARFFRDTNSLSFPKILIIGILLLVIGFFCVRNSDKLRIWIGSLVALLSNNPSQRAPETTPELNRQVATSVPPLFASFQNPLSSRLEGRQVVIITFHAFEAWAREQGMPRADTETPSEFSSRLVQRMPQFAETLPSLADTYSTLAYGRGDVTPKDLVVVKKTWKDMTENLD